MPDVQAGLNTLLEATFGPCEKQAWEGSILSQATSKMREPFFIRSEV